MPEKNKKSKTTEKSVGTVNGVAPASANTPIETTGKEPEYVLPKSDFKKPAKYVPKPVVNGKSDDKPKKGMKRHNGPHFKLPHIGFLPKGYELAPDLAVGGDVSGGQEREAKSTVHSKSDENVPKPKPAQDMSANAYLQAGMKIDDVQKNPGCIGTKSFTGFLGASRENLTIDDKTTDKYRLYAGTAAEISPGLNDDFHLKGEYKYDFINKEHLVGAEAGIKTILVDNCSFPELGLSVDGFSKYSLTQDSGTYGLKAGLDLRANERNRPYVFSLGGMASKVMGKDAAPFYGVYGAIKF